MKNLTSAFLKKHSKLLTLTGAFAILLFLSAKTFAQPYARIEQTNVHFFDSYAPYGATCDTKIVLYQDEFGTQPYSFNPGNTFPAGGFDVVVNVSNQYDQPYYSQFTPPWYLGNNYYNMTSDTYTLTNYTSGSQLYYSGQWLLIFAVVANPASGPNADYIPAPTYPSTVNY
jgi:hypothetical protein